MSFLELLSPIYSSPLQGHLINRTSRQVLPKCFIRTITLYFRKQKRYSDLSKTTNTHTASLHFRTSCDVREIPICVTATFHVISAKLNSSNMPSFGNTSISSLLCQISLCPVPFGAGSFCIYFSVYF